MSRFHFPWWVVSLAASLVMMLLVGASLYLDFSWAWLIAFAGVSTFVVVLFQAGGTGTAERGQVQFLNGRRFRIGDKNRSERRELRRLVYLASLVVHSTFMPVFSAKRTQFDCGFRIGAAGGGGRHHLVMAAG